jgi:hypothetical protein
MGKTGKQKKCDFFNFLVDFTITSGVKLESTEESVVKKEMHIFPSPQELLLNAIVVKRRKRSEE